MFFYRYIQFNRSNLYYKMYKQNILPVFDKLLIGKLVTCVLENRKQEISPVFSKIEFELHVMIGFIKLDAKRKSLE